MVDIQFQQTPEETPGALKLFTIRLVINSIQRVRQLFDKIIVERSTDSTDGTDGTWDELTTPGTRIPLIQNARNYTYTDHDGRATYWYRIKYLNSRTGRVSPASAAQQGIPSPALSIISVEELITNYLFGLDLTDDSGTMFPDSLFQHYIEAATQYVQDKLDIVLPATQILDERHDFIRQDYNKFVWMQLDCVPVISIERVRMVLPTNQQIIDYDLSWIYPDKDSGHVEIVPNGNQLLLGSGTWLQSGLSLQDYIPQVFRVDYTAGFRKVPADIKDAIGMIASLGPLNIAGDLIGGPGIASQSISLDGVSQSINTTSSATNAGYGARVIQYTKIFKDMWPTLKGRYHPLRFSVV